MKKEYIKLIIANLMILSILVADYLYIIHFSPGAYQYYGKIILIILLSSDRFQNKVNYYYSTSIPWLIFGIIMFFMQDIYNSQVAFVLCIATLAFTTLYKWFTVTPKPKS